MSLNLFRQKIIQLLTKNRPFPIGAKIFLGVPVGAIGDLGVLGLGTANDDPAFDSAINETTLDNPRSGSSGIALGEALLFQVLFRSPKVVFPFPEVLVTIGAGLFLGSKTTLLGRFNALLFLRDGIFVQLFCQSHVMNKIAETETGR